MLVTGITQNVTESIDAVTLLDEAVVGPTSNIPRSPMAQLHFPLQQQVEWDGYDSDSSVDHNAAIHSKGPLEVDEPDIPEAGNPVLPTNEDQPCRILGLTALNSLLRYVNWLVWEVCSVN